MDEFQHFEKLDSDKDFEGGQWIGDEYVYTKRKKKAQQTEDDRLYGVFQGSSDDEDEGFRKKRRKKTDDTRSLHKPMAFVSSGVVTQTTEAPEEPEEEQPKAGVGANTASADPRHLRSRGCERRGAPCFAGTVPPKGLVGGYGNESDDGSPTPEAAEDEAPKTGMARAIQHAADERRAAAARQRESAAKRTKNLKSDPELAKFETHSKGIGSKLLKLMGWKPGEGLGAKKDGIAKPLEAALRPKLAGLGAAGGEKGLEAPGTRPKKDEMKPEMPPGGGASAFKLAWQARHRKKAAEKEVFKTAEQLLADDEAAGGQPGGGVAGGGITILDMTGPQTRVVTDMETLNKGGGDAAAGDEALPFPELQHNLKLLVELAEADIRKLVRSYCLSL